MPSPGGRDFQQAYNCLAVVDSAHQVIVAAEATNQATDKEQAVAMIEQAIGDTGTVPKEVSAGLGLLFGEVGRRPERPGGRPVHRAGEDPPRHSSAAGFPGTDTPKGLSARDRMRRKETVEPAFGQIKQGRDFRQFLLRGLEKVNRE